MAIISVIIPAYNAQDTIRETIESVLNQTFSNFELIIINDGSTDSTLDIIESIEDKRIQIFSYENTGLPASRNRGMAHAQGEFISFLDADDFWNPNKLEAQYQALQNNPQAAVAYSWTDWIYDNSQPLGEGIHITANGNVYEKLLLQDFIANGSNPLIRREALKKVGHFDQSLNSAEDWDMWLRLARYYHFIAVPFPHIFYRKSANSMSTNVKGMEESSLRIIENALAQAPPSIQQQRQKILAKRYQYLTYKSIELPLGRRKGFVGIRFFLQMLYYDITMFPEPRLLGIIVIKLIASLIVPKIATQTLIKKKDSFKDEKR